MKKRQEIHKYTKTVVVGLLLFIITSASANDFDIRNFGAVSGGKVMNTSFIQKAIDAAHTAGGGRVIVPNGTYLSGTIILKSNVELHLEKRALLLGSTDPIDYFKIARWKALVMADNAQNIAVTGKGTIDGQGSKLALHIDSLFYAGEIDSSQYNFVEMRPIYYLRPQIIEFVDCKYVQVKDVTLKNSACWVQTYERCKYVDILGITVDSDAYWNNDGIDISGSQNVRIANCDVNAADDGICLKTERTRPDEYCDSIVIENCRVRSSASAIKFGTSSKNDMRNIVVRNIKVYDTYRSAIAIEAAQNGVLENILIENIVAKNTGNAIFLRIGQIRSATEPGTLRNVTIRNVKVMVPFENPDDAYEIRGPELPYFHNVYPSSIVGIKGHLIQDVTIENIKIIYPGRGNQAYASMPLYRINEIPEHVHKYPEFSMFRELPAWAFYIRHAEGIKMKNVKVKIKKPDYRTAFVLDDVRDSKFQNIKIKGDVKNKHFYECNTENIILTK